MVNKGENTMALPTLTVPHYSLKIPSTEQEVSYRPFLVKEEKILLMAAESENDGEMANAMVHIITNCIENEEIDVNLLPTFDLEYIFLQIRAKSVGETSEIEIKCENIVAGEDGAETQCGAMVPISVDLTKLKVKFNKKHTNNIKLEENIGVTLRYPDLGELAKIAGAASSNDVQDSFDLMSSCIETIYDAESVNTRKDFTDGELNDWIEGLNDVQLQKIHEFFSTMPALKHDVKYECKKCKHKGKLTLSGLNDFFA